MFRPALACVLSVIAFAPFSPAASAASLPPQTANAGGILDAPPGASAAQLTQRGDELRAEKALPGALEYYQAALTQTPESASLRNRIAIVDMELSRWKLSIRELELAIHADPEFADAYNNLGVDYYEIKNPRKAISCYRRAIRLNEDEASFYSNLGAAYFSKKQFQKAVESYGKALQLDPEVLEHTSRTGVSARLPSPDDRARFDYAMAKLYAKMGSTDHSLEHLRRALEEGYKHIDDVYRDEEFAGLRKDPRFTQLMTKRPVPLPE